MFVTKESGRLLEAVADRRVWRDEYGCDWRRYGVSVGTFSKTRIGKRLAPLIDIGMVALDASGFYVLTDTGVYELAEIRKDRAQTYTALGRIIGEAA
jgi:hypothetical protein